MLGSIDVTPLGPGEVAAQVVGVDDEPSGEVAEALVETFSRFPVLCLRTGGLTSEQLVRLAGVFGRPQLQVLADYRRSDHPEISVISSEQFDQRGDGRKVVFGAAWHTDDSYLARPAAVTALYAHVIPSTGGDTLFADCRAAYAALSEADRSALEGVAVEHRYQARRNLNPVPSRSPEEEAATPPVVHPLVLTHPVTGRPALYLNPNRMDHVVGVPLDEGDSLLDRLIAHATADRFVYRHRWQPHDLVLWDNRCTMHKASDDYGGERREMHRLLLEAV